MLKENLTEVLYVRCTKTLKKAISKLAKGRKFEEATYVRDLLIDDAKFKLGDKYGKR